MGYGFGEPVRGGEGEMKDDVMLMLDGAQVKGVMVMLVLWEEGRGSVGARGEETVLRG